MSILENAKAAAERTRGRASSPRPTWPAALTSTGSPSSSRGSTRRPDPAGLIRVTATAPADPGVVEDHRPAMTAGPRWPVGYLQ